MIIYINIIFNINYYNNYNRPLSRVWGWTITIDSKLKFGVLNPKKVIEGTATIAATDAA